MINVEDMIRAQIASARAHELRFAARERRKGRGIHGGLSYGPYVLISREEGAGGSAVAKLVGGRLNWQVFDERLVDAVAEKAHVRRELIESIDERDRSSILDVVEQLVRSESIESTEYVRALHSVIHALGHQGDVVIVGRGAELTLPSQFGLRVRLVAPHEVRVRRIAMRNNSTVDAARSKVDRSDRDRANLARLYLSADTHDPLLQDVVINTADLSGEAAADIVMTALKAKLEVDPSQAARDAT